MSYLTDPFSVPELPPTARSPRRERPRGAETRPPDDPRTAPVVDPVIDPDIDPDIGPDIGSDVESGIESDVAVRPAPGASTMTDRRGLPPAAAEGAAAGPAVAGVDVDGDRPAPVALTRPAEGIPDVVEDEHVLLEAAEALRAGVGPLAIDAERASGYRYGQRAYLVQMRREGAGTWLVDPIACPDLSPIDEAVRGVEWILHAATQDLACLREVGLHPSALFDTELGARLAGLPRVGLAAVVEHYLGVTLAKEHSAVDWSTRPLPEDWLNYAALDVECLGAVRDAMAADLESQGKAEWARQEFEALTSFTGHPTRVDPWRRVSGLRRLRTPRMAAVVRELWYARDDLARSRDTSPGRVVPDAVLVALATAEPKNVEAAMAATGHKTVRRHPEIWVQAVRRAHALPESELPPTSLPAQGPPPPRSWADREPIAAARLAMARGALTTFAEDHHLPLENLLTPDTLRRVIWTPPAEPDEAATHGALLDLGARPWQADIAAPIIAHAFATAEPA